MAKIYNFEDYCAPTLAEQTADVELPWEDIDDEELTDNDHYYNAQFRKENNMKTYHFKPRFYVIVTVLWAVAYYFVNTHFIMWR